MAARILKPRHQDDIRQKIQATQLVNRLTNHAFGKVEMSATQLKAAEILLKKSLPDLSQIQGPNEDGSHSVTNEITLRIVDTPG